MANTDINTCSLSGGLTADPVLRSTASGYQVLSFSIAVSERRKVGDDWEDYSNYVDCTMFGKRAESIAAYLHKGMRVMVSGKLHYDKWETNDGQKRSKLSVTVDELVMPPKPKDGPQGAQDAPRAVRNMQRQANPQPAYEQVAYEPTPVMPRNVTPQDYTDEIPF